MSKRAEKAAKEIYEDGIQLVGRRDRNNNLVIHPETMVGILRNAAQKGYEQAEKDLALTLAQVVKLDNIIMNMVGEGYNDGYKTRPFYEEVLKRFNA